MNLEVIAGAQTGKGFVCEEEDLKINSKSYKKLKVD